MKKLFLCSSFADVASLLFDSVLAPSKGKTVAFIPTASLHEPYTQYVEDGKAALEDLGLVVRELEITQYDKDTIAEVLNECDLIYLSGGNTFFLMQALINTGAGELLAEQVRAGKLYIGELAGAMVGSPNIEYAKGMDDASSLTPQFTDFGGLHIVDFFPLPHFNSFPFEAEAKQILQTYSHLPLIPISNEQAIVVVDEEASVCTRE